VSADLLLHGLLDVLDPLQIVHALIDLAWVGADVWRTCSFLRLQQQEISILSRHDEGEGEPDIIRVPERVPHGTYIPGHLLHGASLLQHGRSAMVLLDVPSHTVEHLCDRLELCPREGKAPLVRIGLHGDPLFLVLAGEPVNLG
jgi:hypothetical protein